MEESHLKFTKNEAPKIVVNWSRAEEIENFAKTVKLYRQGKIDKDIFRRFRLQLGGTRRCLRGNAWFAEVGITLMDIAKITAKTRTSLFII